MIANSLFHRFHRRYVSTTDSEHDLPKATNLLNRRFNEFDINQARHGDITYIPTAGDWLYLVSAIDLGTRRLVGYEFCERMSKQLVLNALKRAYNNERLSPGSIFYSDQGETYTSPMYRDTAESYNLVLSYSRKGNCYDSACMQNFYGHLKSETIYQLPITQRYCLRRKEVKKIINDYIIWYNNERIQAKLNYLSPVDFCLKNYQGTVAI